MSPTVLITAATGTVGRLLVRRLTEAGIRPRALVRDAANGRALLGEDVDIAVGDLADGDAVRDALTGVDAMFLACGNVPGQVELECAAVDAARSAAVRRVVKLSARGAARTAAVAVWRAHATIEQHLAASGVPAVILRPTFFMSNLLAVAEPVRHFGALPAAAGTAPIAMIDPADIAAVAARLLLESPVTGGAATTGVLELTGPEALTYHQVAERLSEVTRRAVSYVDVTPGDAAQAMTGNGIPEPVVGQILEIFAALRAGAYTTVTDAVPLVTGRPARTLDGYLRHHADAFATLVNR
jgi:uncharacterized protein YbjT (DUF2867 family)